MHCECCILFKLDNVISKDPVIYKTVLVQKMVWYQTGDKLLHGPIMAKFYNALRGH